MKREFEGKVALVTGGGSGIGRSVAVAFARNGAAVAVAGRTSHKVLDTVQLIKRLGGEAIPIECDASVDSHVQRMLSETLTTFGRLDFACNAAAVNGIPSRLSDTTEEDFDSVLNINLKGVWLCMKYEIRQMLAQGTGSIVNISSINGLSGTKGASVYSASKHGVIGLTKSAALEYAKSNLRINVICPGAIQTPGLEEWATKIGIATSAIQPEIPMGRIGNPDEIATAVTWLCSDESSFITGHVMVIDGGETA